MLSALRQLGSEQEILAYECTKEDGPFYCRFCNYQMRRKEGPRVTAHFAHVPKKEGEEVETCAGVEKYGHGGESEDHRNIKRQIFEDAKKHMETKGHFKFVKMEHRIGKTIGDVVLIGDKRKVVVEVQMSPLSCQKMLDRMEEHKKHGFFTLWVVKSPAPIKEMEESAEKFGSDGVYWKVNSTYQDIHWILGGWLLFYNGDLHFTPAHLGGRRYVYHKFFFLNRDDIHLFKLVDREINEVNVVTVHENLKWWDKKNANKVSA